MRSSPGSGAFAGLPYSLPTRIGAAEGKTSPEELLAAAHAGCFTMGLAAELTDAEAPAERLDVTCTITMDEVEGQGHQIVGSAIEAVANAPGLDPSAFDGLVEAADAGCPFSTLLKNAGATVVGERDPRAREARLDPGMAGTEQLVEELERSYLEARDRMSDPAVYNDRREGAEAGRRLKELEGPYRLAMEWRQISEDLEAARADGDLKELVPELEQRLEELEEELRLSLVEADPVDRKDTIVEVRQGVGGDEAALWAADVVRMLTRYAERRGFKWEQLSVNPNEAGGIKEAVFAVKGDGAYSVFKWEAGTHRVQRVPETESQGRIHTSTATVAVMPEAEEVEVEIDQNDLKIDVYRSTGPGGQSVNTTDSAVRITHVPTGVVVAMQDEKSQLQNKVKAMRVLRARIYELERERQQAEQSATRRAQIGGGERAEKIRTYNFAESRVTDHRIKLTVHRLDQVLQGELEEFTEALAAEERRRALETASA